MKRIRLTWDAFYLATRTPAQEVKYLLSDDFEFKYLMLQIVKYYPRPAPIYPAGQLRYTNEYLYLSHSPRKARLVNPNNR